MVVVVVCVCGAGGGGRVLGRVSYIPYLLLVGSEQINIFIYIWYLYIFIYLCRRFDEVLTLKQLVAQRG